MEINLTNSQTATMQTSVKASSWSVISGTLDIGGNAISVDTGTTGVGDVTIGANGTLISSATGSGNEFIRRTGSTAGGVFTVTGLLQLSGAASRFAMSTINLNGTVEYTASGAQALTIASLGGTSPSTYTNLKLSGTNAKTLSQNTTVNGTLTLAGTTAALALSTFTLTYGASSTLEYAGSGAQTTATSEFPSSGSAANLQINNSNGVNLHAARSVSSLILTGGKLTTSLSNLLTVTDTSAAVVTGGSASSYINGPLARVLPASLATGSTYSFPVGKAGFNPFELVNPTTTAGGTVTFMAEAFDGSTGGTAGSGLSSLNTDRYWQGTITANSAFFTNTKVKLTNSSALAAINRIGKSETAPPGGTYVSIGGSVSGSTITSDPISTFSYFVIASASCPTSFTVNNTGSDADAAAGDGICATSGSVCTLRAAIEEANALTSCSGAIDIGFSVSGTVTGPMPVISHPVNINGPASGLTVSGNNAAFVFRVASTVSMDRLTIVDGNTTNVSLGAGIHNTGTLTVTNSTISNNSGSISGGGIFNSGTFNLTNSTISGNTASTSSGGIQSSGTTTLTNCTVSGNQGFSHGGVRRTAGTVTLLNTIIAGNTITSSGFPDFGDTANSLGNNFIGNADGATGFVGSDLTGTTANPLDPKLAPLGNYGGPTMTRALLSTSTAINAGTNSGAPATDQRGQSRVGTTDIGAYEVNSTLTVGPGTLPNFTIGVSYSQNIIASGGTGPYSYVVGSGGLPTGLTLSTAGVLSGTPTANGSFTFTVLATDANGAQGEQSYTVQNLAPEIDVKGGTPLVSIPDGDTSPGTSDDTEYGNVNVGASLSRTFTIENTGAATLTLGSNAVTTSVPSEYSVTAQPATSVAPGNSTTFTVQFLPSAIGYIQATVNIANDDGDEAPYNFVIQGTGVTADYTVTTTGNQIVVTNVSPNSQLVITEPSAGQINFADSTRYFSVNGGTAVLGDSGNLSLSGITSITVNEGVDNDSVHVYAFTGALPSLTINGGTGTDNVNFHGNITFVANHSLDVNLQDDDPTPGIDGMIIDGTLTVSGTGTIDLRASEYIAIQGGGAFNGKLISQNGNITVEGNQQAISTVGSGGDEPGVVINGGVIQSTGTGNILIKGTGLAGDFQNNVGVVVAGGGVILSTGSGTITVEGTGGDAPVGGGPTAGDSNFGVLVRDADSIISSSTGAVNVTGQGGATNKAGVYGIVVTEFGTLETTGSATLTVNGTGGTVTGGESNVVTSAGVVVFLRGDINGGFIKSTGTAANAGNIVITGTATLGGIGAAQGFLVDAPGEVTTVDGSITITGNAADCGAVCLGASIRGNITATGSGAIDIIGTGATGTGATHGVNVRANPMAPGGVVSVKDGNLTITGTGGSGSDNAGFNMASVGTGTLQTTGTGTITVNADTIKLNPNASINAGANAVTLRQKTNGTFINLGSTVDSTANTLELSDAELDLVTAGTLKIGDNNSESITVSADITRSASTNMALTAGCDIVISGGQLNTGGGTQLLDSGPSPDAVKALKAGTDVTANTLSFGSDLAIVINGTAFDTDYTQLNVAGDVNLTGVTLALSGSHSPAIGQTFTIVNNEGGNAITGTFTGLAEGAIIPNFLTPGASATITYVGGTGNDVVLTVQAVPVAEISVEQPAGIDLPHGSAFVSFGNEDVGVAGLPVTFMIKNAGPDPLTITSVTSDNSDFSVNTSSMTSSVAAGGSTTFTVTFTPSSAGFRSGVIQINNNDADENPFDIDVEGTGTCPTELVVNNTGDGSDVNPSDGICETGAGNGICTLRAAIEEANELAGNCGFLEINFTIPGTDPGHVYYKDDGTGSANGTVSEANITPTLVSNDASLPTSGALAKDPDYPHSWWQIKPATVLPALTVDVKIDGYTQTGASPNTKHLNEGNDAILRIELNGSLLTNDDEIGLELTAESSSEIRGLVIYYFPTDIRAGGDSGETIAGNFLGTDVSGTLVDTNPTPLGVRVGVYVDGDDGTFIGGDSPEDRNLISGHGGEGGAGIWIAADWASVEGNYIGTDRNGAVALANSYGVLIVGGSLNTIGCYVLDGDNVISGNSTGVRISGGDTNYIVGNFIGTDKTGQQAVPNGIGVVLYQTSSNFVGEPGAGNVISGNTGDGVEIRNSSTGNQVLSNLIGVAADGTTALGNGSNGVEIWIGSADNVVGFYDDGGTLATWKDGSANTRTTGKAEAAARLARKARTTPQLAGKDGTATRLALAYGPYGGNTIANNGANGVQVTNASDIRNRITQNSIYSNTGLGINLVGPSDPSNGVTINDTGDGDPGPNALQNFPEILSADVGTQTITAKLNTTADSCCYVVEFFVSPAGTCDPSNYGEGKKYIGSTTIGPTDLSGDVSLFTFNGSFAAGKVITATATDEFGNTSEFSQCFVVPAPPATPDVSVTVTPSSVTEDGGTNLVYQFSRTDATGVLTVSFAVSGSATFNSDYTQTGAATFSSSSGTVTFGAGSSTVDVTIAPTTDTDPEADEDVTLRVTSGSGYNVTIPDIATGTIQDNDCPASLLVNSNGDSSDTNAGDGHCDTDSGTSGDQCTLRAAIQEVNALNACANFIEINFNIPGGGVHTITPGSPLPSIQHSVTINGYSQPGAIENTSIGANNAVLLIELTGLSAGSGADGLVLQAGSTVIKGLVINRFGGVAIRIPSSGNEVIGNFIGTDATGMLAGDGNGPFGNDVGVRIYNGAVNQIGCTFAEERNIISGNLDDGVQITGMSAFLNFVQGNFIGVQRDGVSALGNGGIGVEIYEGGVSTLIGGETNPPPSQDPGTPAPAGNIIAFNGEEGVLITAAPDIFNQIMQNSIYSNGLLGINLVKPASPGPVDPANGVTDNDAGDGDAGPNNLQNFPVITSANVGMQTINGTLNSTPNRFFFTIEFFRSPSCDPSGHGEGKTYIGSVSSVDTDSNGDASFSLSSPLSAFIPGEAITATATDALGNTSEFSQCFIVAGVPTNADLGITKTASPDPAIVGNNLTYSIAVYNYGPDAAANVVVTDTLPGNVTFVSATPSSGSCTGTSTITCNLGALSNGVEATVQIVVTPLAAALGTDLVNSASVSSNANEPGPDPHSNTAMASTHINDCPTNFTVTDNGDTGDFNLGDGVCSDPYQQCTLRAAIEEANALINCATIQIDFAIASSTIVLTNGQLSVEHNVNIVGPTSDSVIVNGNGVSRVFTIGSDQTVSIANLTITGGEASPGNGGGILNPGTLTLNGVTLSGNSAVDGGAIWSTTNNSLTLINTTISGNSASGNGGGLYNDIGQARLTNVTIAYNTANSDNLGTESGGGIFVASGDVTIHNTIVADNQKGLSLGFTPDDIAGTVNAASSYNVVGTGSGGLTNGGPTHNQVGVASALLGALIPNGGPTLTHALVYNSPAVDAGDDCVVTGCSGNSPVVTTDQRGLSRQPPPDGDNNGSSAVDIGAYERQLTEVRDVPYSSLATVDIVDAIVTLPCTGECEGGERAKRDTAIAPAFAAPVVTLTNIDPSPLNSLTRPANLVIGNSSSPALPAFEVTTTARYTPPATVCFYLPSITNATFFAGLKILHREAGLNLTYGDSDDVMVDVTRATNPTDFANKLVCSEVSSFSAFAIAHTATPTAANGTVSGQILDTNGNPVEGAAVRMTGTQNRLTVTDAGGNYNFDDVETNGFYTVVPSRANFAFSPSQRAFSPQGQNTNAAFNATLANAGLNPLDTTVYFVRQQYVDFLGREPDEAGLNFWVNNIESCGENAQCREAKRIDTSAAFFLSIEFQETGYLVYRMYQSAYGDMPGTPVPLSRGEFKPDTAAMGNGVVVLKSGWETVLDNNKQAFAAAFVQRARFASAYQSSLTPSEFVDKLFANAGVTPAAIERSAAISEFGAAATSADAAARGRALRRVAENGKLAQQEFNQAFVLMEYFGYLQRDANAGQDTDFTGYNFWLNKLNTFGGNFHQAEMVKAFLSSIEYRGRFPR
jgi:uncharacterized repeat protein (TIGR01451 family)/CSLREA domain-containing protein